MRVDSERGSGGCGHLLGKSATLEREAGGRAGGGGGGEGGGGG